jgi:hypothetical protein
MSRWDVLKSDTPDPKGRKRAPRSRVLRPEPRNGPQLDRNVSAHARLEKYALLRDECCKITREPFHIDALAQVVATSLDILPAEEMARDVVQGIFLPFLEEVSPTTTTNTTDRQILNAQLAVFHAIHSLLKNRKHASAVMAPLVNDVTIEGNENQVANPIRCNMFRALQLQLLLKPPSNPGTDARPWEDCCQCLTQAIQEAKTIDGTKHHAGMADTDIDAAIVRRFLSCTLAAKTASGRIQKLSLELLHALIQRHPESALTLATSSLLLMASPTVKTSSRERHSSECSRCGYSGTSLLLGAVHETHADRGLAMECTAELLHNLPLHLWLRNERRGPEGHRKFSQSTFRQQVSDGLLNTIRVARCFLDRVDDERNVDSLVHLIKVILLEIPYEDENDDLHKMASLLAKESLALLLDDTQRSSKLRDEMTDVLVGCMGGRVTPQGHLTNMVSPISSWFSCTEGQEFIRALLLAAQEQDNPRKVLRAVVRSSPQSMWTAGDTWDLFQQCVRVQVGSRVRGSQLAGLHLVEAMLRGRKDFGLDDTPGAIVSKALVSFVAPLLQKAITIDNSSCKCAGVAAYGSLVGIDWVLLSAEGGGCLARVRSILVLCDGGGKRNAKVRSETCKAVGDICAEYFSADSFQLQDMGEVRLICDEVCVVVERAMNDTVASVRSMALYAAGNLAQSLLEDAVPLVVNPVVFSRLMLRVRDLMDDHDDKVTGNAIRSVAHAVCLLLREDHSAAFKDTTVEPRAFLNGVMKSLSTRILLCISLARGGKSERSWKERTAIKKHGWGASNSLATIFSDIVIDDAVLEACQDAVAALVECLEALQVVHEKVALSSMVALRSVQPRSLSRLSGKSALVGRAVITCLVHNSVDHQMRDINEKIGRELDLVLLHLLQSCSIADAHAVLLSDSVTVAHLGYLYQWMVENDCTAGAFDSFAIAMQRSDVLVDVQVEQRFASRAMSLLQIHDQGDDEL